MEIDAVKTVKVDARTIKVHAIVRDGASYTLCDQHGAEICDRDEVYVPGFFPETGGGDYLYLEIEIDTGRILNWKPPTKKQIEEWIKEGG